ncbi:protein NRT1/ PTR FAMILY 6.4 [Phalaenopsis equestris]|uniref:protein NRT1/ PTR FAMILY 6.4 n=1 Tax=Phalaenopsis equestris TaxID=78828 RepID=UPI0009E4A8F4|nr:protein NRT1/ PTR FAMILY 6.4 [Phalaenopsis equestris]
MDSTSSLESCKQSAVDFRGNPAEKSKTGGWLAAGLILGTELSERVCVIGIAMNLVTYLVGDLHLSSSRSANIVTNFMGTLNLLALLGGFAADAKFGRFLTVAISAAIAAAGTCLLTMATSLSSMQPPACTRILLQEHECVPASGGQQAMLFAALYTIAAGAGGIKANVSGFGSDQFDMNDPKEEKAMLFFFNRFYFCISLGSLFAVTVLFYLQDNVGRGWGYGISAGVMVAAMLILFAGTTRYRFRRPQGSPLTVVWRVVWQAWRKRGVGFPARVEELNGYEAAVAPHTDRLRWLDKAAILQTNEISASESVDPETKAVKTNQTSTVTEVEEVKMVLKLLPIWAACIMFWTIYSQMTTFSVEQATYMNRRIGSFAYPSGSLSLFLFITVLVVTSLNEKLFVPLARRFTHNVQGITSLQRVGIGLIFSVLAMAVAAAGEMGRGGRLQNEGKNSISVFWLVPQFCLVGMGEGFAYVGQLEFFIREAPEKMKSMSTGLFLSTLSMGFFLSSVLVTVVDKVTSGGWIKNNLNKGRLDYFYWMLAVLGVLNFLVFSVFSSRHHYKVQKYQWTKNQGEELKVWTDESSEVKQHGEVV